MNRFGSAAFMATLFLLLVSLTVSAQEATPEITPEVTSPALPELTETIFANAMSAHFPKGWTPSPFDNAIFLVNITPVKLGGWMGEPFSPGQVQIGFSIWQTSQIFPINNLAADASPLDYMTGELRYLGEAIAPEYINEPEAFMLDGKRAASLFMHRGTGDVELMAIEYEPGIMIIFDFFTAPGELDQWKPTVLAIAASIQYLPAPPLGQDYETADQHLIVHYPTGWVIDRNDKQTGEDLSITLATNEAALSKGLMGITPDFLSGEARWFAHIAPLSVWAQTWPELTDSTTPEAFLNILHQSAAQLDWSPITPFYLRGRPAAQAFASADDRGEQIEWAIQYENNRMGLFILTTASGESEQWLPTLLAIAEYTNYGG
ncbi:MAG: hypothetical protein ABI690_12765 [Chloroflexota bacterium]